MEKKQSSIEWLENEIDFILTTYSYNSQDFHLNKAFEKAKAMHKEEVQDAYCKAGLDIAHNDSIKESGLAQEYYNETFGGNNE